MTDDKHSTRGTGAQSDLSDPSGSPPPGDGGPDRTRQLVDQLTGGFREQLDRALGIPLEDDPVALAYVDHYLSLLRREQREPILRLIAAQAGAWFGELICREIGARWVGDGTEPRRLRLLLEPAFVHFSPVDMAYEAIFSGPPGGDDPRLPEGAELDGAYHLRKRAPADAPAEGPAALSDHEWVLERLDEAPPMPEDQYYSLTGRFETLLLILELLATRAASQGREPTLYHLNDYLEELAG
ncbi:hypothetical protein G6O69_30615 [Pseudenhygromyxa sp. WMMC2535]|uniref:hypothetical protein n=1 Tax=Pseudenhygromyxa sp. WMMC2535 TaxID=2712867 RepID=UPI001558071D|nr:hypothetical protein [Pseudenhygromyxa sp. WMMC2535]NVB42216.1 hypothetical protein [Pseudenhygromyxa sp. WMMC2535]